MQSFSRKTRRTEKGDLNIKCVDVMKQGWPQRSFLTSVVRLTLVSSTKYNTEVVYMHTRLTVNGVLKDILKEGVQQSKLYDTNLL
jgi:hypothetical protein